MKISQNTQQLTAKASFKSNDWQKCLIAPATTLAVALPLVTPALVQERAVAMPQQPDEMLIAESPWANITNPKVQQAVKSVKVKIPKNCETYRQEALARIDSSGMPKKVINDVKPILARTPITGCAKATITFNQDTEFGSIGDFVVSKLRNKGQMTQVPSDSANMSILINNPRSLSEPHEFVIISAPGIQRSGQRRG